MQITNINSYQNNTRTYKNTFKGGIYGLTPSIIEKTIAYEAKSNFQNRTVILTNSEKQLFCKGLISFYNTMNNIITNKFSPLVCFFPMFYSDTRNEWDVGKLKLAYPIIVDDQCKINSKCIEDLSPSGLEKHRHYIEDAFLNYLIAMTKDINMIRKEFRMRASGSLADPCMHSNFGGIDRSDRVNFVYKTSEIIKSTYDWIEKNPDVYPSDLNLKLYQLKELVDCKIHEYTKYNNEKALEEQRRSQNINIDDINMDVIIDEEGKFSLMQPCEPLPAADNSENTESMSTYNVPEEYMGYIRGEDTSTKADNNNTKQKRGFISKILRFFVLGVIKNKVGGISTQQ